MKNTILIIGANGTVGSEVARLLVAQGHHVKLATSKPITQPNQVQLNLGTGEGVHAAFEGVDKAFLISPPGYANQYAILSPLIQEAKRRGLKKTVLMTALGANADENSPFRRAEVELEKSGLDYNIVRPNWFMQNFATFWVQAIKENRKIQLPAGSATTSFIDAKDVAAVVAKLLTIETYPKQAFDLTGPESLDHVQIAQAISEVISQKVVYEEISSDLLKQGLEGAGLPKDYVAFLILIFGFLREGYNSRTTGDLKAILGREGNTFMNYAKTAHSAWV